MSDKQVTIKVFQLDDCDWWAGESLAVCIEEGRRQCGSDCYDDAEEEGHEVSPEGMQRLTIRVDEDNPDAPPITFAEHLAALLADGKTEFPHYFCSTE